MDHRFYAIQTTAGNENKVRSLIQRKIESDPKPAEERMIRQALVPTQEVVEIKNGKKVNVERKIFPGYVLVEMVATDEAWSVVRNTPQVTGFVGTANQAVPLEKEEVDKILKRTAGDTVRHAIDLAAGDAVIIIDGPFKDLEGKVGEVDEERGKVKVLVPMFGRETPVELDSLQVKKL